MKKLIPGLCLLAAIAFPVGIQAKQFAMVVGIDDYQHFKKKPAPGEFSDLAGAVNDAEVIAKALRGIGVDLPPERFLTDHKATLKGFIDGWVAMTRRAKPGDTLIVSFSGHGGQEKEVTAPFDEKRDGYDETIMFYEFDPKNPRRGRLNDDQLRTLLADASQFNIIWVMDSCHSAGLTRAINPRRTGKSRNAGKWVIPVTPIVNEIKAEKGDDGEPLPHVTQILATASEDRLVYETIIEGKNHGALSWFFSKGISGEADANKDGLISRREIASYLSTRVVAHMNQNQQPSILPRGDNKATIQLTSLVDDIAKPDPVVPPVNPVIEQPKIAPKPDPKPTGVRPVKVKVDGKTALNFEPGSVELTEEGAELVFEETESGWTVFNHTGDIIKRLAKHQAGLSSALVARASLLRELVVMISADLPGVKIQPDQTAAIQKLGAKVGFTFIPPSPELNSMVLFNMAGDGQLQMLYPTAPTDRPQIPAQGFPLRFQVTPPTGSDQLVAIFCEKQPQQLVDLLNSHNGSSAPKAEELKQAMQGQKCQVGRIGLFTESQST